MIYSLSAKTSYLKSENDEIGRFWGFFSISLDFDAADGGMAQCLCLRQWVGLNAHARGYGRGLMQLPEAVGVA